MADTAGSETVDCVEIGGMPVTTLSRDQLARMIVEDCRGEGTDRRARLVFDANGHAIALYAADARYRAAMDKADIIHADGGFLVTLSRWLCPRPIRERSATTDLFGDIASLGRASGLRVFLLGGSEVVSARCAALLEHRYPGIVVAGRRNGYFTLAEEGAVVASINASRPDIVWIGMGKPTEQLFAARHRAMLHAHWVITCGGCFEFFIGTYRRAPMWMQRSNLEWLHRMMTRPRALFWRYLTTSPHALWIVLSGARPRFVRER